MEATGIPDGAGVTQYDDSRIHDNAQPVIITKIEMPKESPWKQPAIYVAVFGVVFCALLILFFEWQRWTALEDVKRSFTQQVLTVKTDFAQKLVDIRDKQHDYYEEINVYEIDGFNREKDVEELLKQATGIDAIKLLGKPRHPPIPKGN